jgi:sulfatase maturation enzyme AslB (radical SAM superfamily)
MAWFNGITNRIAVLDSDQHESLAANHFADPHAAEFAERMREAGILIPADRNENRLLKTYAERFVRPFQFTIELSRVCNFKCTYCYQNGTHDARKVMSGPVFEASRRYVEQVLRGGGVTEMELNFIGGEPMLHRARIIEFKSRIQATLDQTGVPCRTVIDTNGAILPPDFMAQCENTTFSVSLTPEEDHNRNRPFLGGQGSFKTVVSNLIANRKHFGVRGNELIIRYNLGHGNAAQLTAFLDYLADLRIPATSFMVVNVENYEFNPAYRNEFGPQQYWEYCGVALDRMVRNDIPVRTLPYGVITPCHVFKPYSCKVFYDGRLNGCDVSDEPGDGNIFEVAAGGEIRGRRNLNPLTHKMCQGDYKICNLQVFPLQSYLTAYLSAVRAGKAHLFRAFEEHGAKMRHNWGRLLQDGPGEQDGPEQIRYALPAEPQQPFVILQ